MDFQPSPVCVVNTVSSYPEVIIGGSVQNGMSPSTSESLLYLISLDQEDGTSQIVQVTKEQASALGISIVDSPKNNSLKTVESAKKKQLTKNININLDIEVAGSSPKPLGSCENPIEIIKDGEVLHSTQNISAHYLQQIAKALDIETAKEINEQDFTAIDDSENVVYRVMFPDELDLKPPNQTKRGRPKKRPRADTVEPKDNVKMDEDAKPVQNARTRSGRITRPPRYIKKEFRKIEMCETDNNESDLKVVEFEPLKTNQASTMDVCTPVETENPTIQKRKRAIASQYRCPKCRKAYMGHNRMLKHLQKHPDHGPLPKRSKVEENDTWNYLIDISNTNSIGQRGLKLCNQLATLVTNIQLLAKLLFKRSSGTEKNLYFINSLLSKVLGIETGNYIINENELKKDVNLLSFLPENTTNINDLVTEPNSKFDLHAYVEKNPLDNSSSVREQLKQNNGITLNNTCSTSNFSCNLEDTNKNNNQGLNFHQELHFEPSRSPNFDDIQKQNKLDGHSINIISSSNTQQSDLRNTSEYSLQNVLLSDNSLLSSLPTLRNSVEDLMLSNVDGSQVTNLLDNSTSSDEVINVDQFVNERFQNFTETDIELPNQSLGLDLPSLELFQFHSS